jgi:putative membrane protein
MNQTLSPDSGTRAVVLRIVALSAAAFAFLLWLLYFRAPSDVNPDALAFLPAVNAALNGLAAACILAGVIAIKSGRKRLHMGLMISAVSLSVVFLISYVAYHNLHGDTRFVTGGWIRYFYFSVLISHITCTVFALPLIMSAVYFAVTKRFELHKRVVKYTVPIWLYVSITGVAIYFLLKANS